MRNLAENIWIFDGDSVPFLTLPFTTRMTVVRIGSELWVHSPIRLTEIIREQIQSLGQIKYLIAPNHLHHLFIGEWLAAYPDAQSYGTDQVIHKRNDLRFDGSLNNEQSYPWEKDISQVLFTGSPLMEECVFFHNQSSTLIVTDLIENFPAQHFNSWQRLLAKGVGILAPNGKMPLDWRMSFMFGRSTARQHIEKIIGWKPEKIVMAHGVIVEEAAADFLPRSFSWLI